VDPEWFMRLVYFRTGQIQKLLYQHIMYELRQAKIERGEPHDDTPRADLLFLLRMTREMEATDPRDKLYALLGVDDVRDIPVHPNYQHSVLQVYTDFTVDYIKTRADLEILAEAGIGIPKRDLQLPSWVPDLRRFGSLFVGDGHTSLDHRASSNHLLNPRIDASRSLLSAAGFVCDVIPAHDEPRELEPCIEEWAKLALSSTCAHPTGMARVQVFFRNMIADTSGYGFGRPEFRDEKEWKDFVDLAKGFMTVSGTRALIYHEKASNSSGEVQYTEKFTRWFMKVLDNSRHAQMLQVFLKLVPDKPVTKTDRELLQPFLASTSPHGEIPWPDEPPTREEEIQSGIRFVEHAMTRTVGKNFFIT
jgi:hypothetical protein